MNPEINPKSAAEAAEAYQTGNFMSRFATSTLARGMLIGTLMVGCGLGARYEANAASSVEQQIPYDTSTGNYPYTDAVLVGDAANSNYEKDGSLSNPDGYDYRNCTDYLWWRVQQEFGKNIAGWHDAGEWDTGAAAAGYQVDHTPEIGDIAQWSPTSAVGAGRFGHVAFVEKVNKDGSVEVAEYNKNSDGAFERRQVLPTGTGRFRMPDNFIDINGKNSDDFKLKLYAEGTAAPLSVNEQTAFNKHEADIATSKANQALFNGIANNGFIRGDNGAWYVRKGDTLQWVVTGDAAAKAIGLDSKRINKTKHYSEFMIHTKEEGYTYTYTQRDKDYAASKFGSRVSMLISNSQMTKVAKQLGFDNALNIVSQGAKGWRFVKSGKQYGVNMDLVAMMSTGRTDTYAYPTDWRGPLSWKAYTYTNNKTERSSFFQLPFADIPLAKYLNVNDLPSYRTRLAYLTSAVAGSACVTSGTVCAWGGGANPLMEEVGMPYLPATVGGFANVKAVMGTHNNGYVIDSEDDVWAWGLGQNGQLGNNKHTPDNPDDLGIYSSDTPVKVNISNVDTLAVIDDATFALKKDGTVWMWGRDNQARGIFGDGQKDVGQIYDQPVQIQGLANVNSLAASGTDVYVTKKDGTVWGWGRANTNQLGAADAQFAEGYTSTPTQVSGLSDIKNVAAGNNDGYALKSDGTVMAWGDANFGGIGNGPAVSGSTNPIKVNGLSGVKEISARGSWPLSSVYSLKTDGTVVAWGEGRHGELGNDELSNKNTPTVVKNLSGIALLGTNEWAAYGIKADGSLMAWGRFNAGGIFGFASNNIKTPQLVAGLTVKSVVGTYAVVK